MIDRGKDVRQNNPTLDHQELQMRRRSDFCQFHGDAFHSMSTLFETKLTSIEVLIETKLDNLTEKVGSCDYQQKIEALETRVRIIELAEQAIKSLEATVDGLAETLRGDMEKRVRTLESRQWVWSGGMVVAVFVIQIAIRHFWK